MLMGMLVGTVNYFSGNVAKNIVDDVLLAIGFRDHSSSSDDDKVTNIAVVGPDGVSTQQTTETYPSSVSHFDYAKLLKMQDEWSNFFGLQRFVQLLAPYLLLGALETGMVCVYVIMFIFTADD